MKKSKGMTKETYEAIKWALRTGKVVADVETGIVINARAKKQGYLKKSGYLQVTFSKDGKQYMTLAHQIVAVAGNLNPVGLQTNHINGDKQDNRLCNLEVISHAENMYHAHKSGLIDYSKRSGSKNGRAKLTEEQVLEIKRLLAEANVKQSQIAKQFNVSNMTITQIKQGKQWTHVTLQESFFNAENQEAI